MSHKYSRKSKIAFPVYRVIIVICVSYGQHLFRSGTGWATRHCPFLTTSWVLLSWKPGACGSCSGILANAIALTLQSLPGWLVCNYNPVCSYSTAIISVTVKMISPTLIKRDSTVAERQACIQTYQFRERSLHPIL